jgi:hypothetical protein
LRTRRRADRSNLRGDPRSATASGGSKTHPDRDGRSGSETTHRCRYTPSRAFRPLRREPRPGSSHLERRFSRCVYEVKDSPYPSRSARELPPTGLPLPTLRFRRRAWLAFQRALDPLAPQKRLPPTPSQRRRESA